MIVAVLRIVGAWTVTSFMFAAAWSAIRTAQKADATWRADRDFARRHAARAALTRHGHETRR